MYGHNFIGCNFVLAYVAHSVEMVSVVNEKKKTTIQFWQNTFSHPYKHTQTHVYARQMRERGRQLQRLAEGVGKRMNDSMVYQIKIKMKYLAANA